MQRFLLEIGVEELPASFLREGLASLEAAARRVLGEARLEPEALRVQGTPRRLALVIEGLPEAQAERREVIQGPPWAVAFKDGAPTKAAEGFARKNGVAVEALRKAETDKGDYVSAEVHEPGRPVAEVIPELLGDIAAGIRFPKTMRWGAGDFAFGRPVQWLVALFGDQSLAFEFAGIAAGRETRGHRFLAPAPVALTTADVYEQVLRDAQVVVDPAERKALMVERLEAAAAELGGTLVPDDFLVGECADLVEAPFVVPGSFDSAFLELPESVVISVMRDHQRYFALRSADGKLMNRYLNVVNTAEAPAVIAEGNDRVLAARLADARFFVAEDRKHGMTSWRPKLDTTVFQRKLGTVGAKVDRGVALSEWLAAQVDADVEATREAAGLAKLDLESLIVFEFPELQGEMGRFYALAEGVEPSIADAIAEHYMPTGADAPVAPGGLGAIVGTADRADTLIGCFGIGLEPTGSNDPFALRRAAISIVRTALEGPIDVDVAALLAQAYDGFDVALADRDEVLAAAARFFTARLRAFYKERFAGDVVEAALGAWDGGSVRDLDARMKAVAGFRERPEYESLAIAFKRANNITKDAEGGAVDP
ncbi:MAG: glycine--tRNA ligase subunit beta, partial [Sandaracinus sp.]|nr:glycine--tRNA ligase subunit beta [Sandaracinus sp.]